MKQKKLLMLIAMVLVVVLCASVLTACKKDKDKGNGNNDAKVYSYRMGPADLPTSWNYHTYQSNSSTYILEYASDALYTFDYNDDLSGYKIVPSMAAGDPVDVTAEYVGKYGITEGMKNKVYAIPLKTNLKFDNGEVINANTFVESMKLLLDPKAKNFRADNTYKSGDLKIFNAEQYVKQNTYAYFEFVSSAMGADEYVKPSDFTTTEEGYFKTGNNDIWININDGGNWGNELSKYAAYNYFFEYTLTEDGFMQYADAKGNVIVLRKDVIVDEKPVAEYYLASDKTTKVYRNDEGAFFTDEDCTKPLEGAEELSAVGTNGQYDVLAKAADKDGYVRLNATLLKAVQDCIAILHRYANVEAYAAKAGEYAYVEFEEMAKLGRILESMDFEDVGFFAKDDNTLCVVLKNAMEDNFYLRYELCTSFFLVNPALYKQCITNSGGVYNNKYGTSVDTFVGYGPYKLTQYVADSTIVLEKNPLWHGFSADEYKAGTYQTDRVVYTLVKDDALRLEMFLKGELDSYGLQEKDMSDYIASDYIYYTDSESTWYLAMNPDFNNLKTLQETAKSETGKKVVKTVLSIQEFRQALSYSLDREQFNLRLSPTSGIAKGLLSAMIVADPESGRTYRSLDEAKDAILEFWGLSDHWGEGKEYATRDDAIASITGYDPAGAKTLFRTAYSKAVKGGMLIEGDDNWIVQIVIGIPVTANFYTDGAEFLATNWNNAVKDTPFEGHLEFVNSQELGGTTFGEYLRNGQVDLLFGVGYAGSMFNPYSMMDCFTGSLQYDVFTDKTTKMMDVTYDFGEGTKTYRASLYDWVSECLQGNKIKAYVVDAEGNTGKEYIEISAGSSDPAERRIAILARAETEIMRLSNIFPVQTDSTAALKGMRINYKTEDYVVGMERGGIQYYTYSMSDAEFADYVKKQGGVLNYK